MSTVDKKIYSRYDRNMKRFVVIGGGAAGLAAAVLLSQKGEVTVLERGERVGRKLSASGNGQGNITNLHMGKEHYFSDDLEKVGRILQKYGAEETISFFERMGGIYLPDERGRVYPAGRQASALTDLLRTRLAREEVRVIYGAKVDKIDFSGDFSVEWERGSLHADAVLLAAGGKAAPNYGTDGQSYALAEKFGHTVTPLKPVLVQIKCDPDAVRGLRGIRVDGNIRVLRGAKLIVERRGDILFTESGISGDASFFISSYAETGDALELDFLPAVSEERLLPVLGDGRIERLLCVVNNGLARALARMGEGNPQTLLRLIKHYPLTVTGTLGFAYAQATRGGIPLSETDENLMSLKRRGLFFAGEILNVDGECGGYNLQWAFASARAAAEGMLT